MKDFFIITTFIIIAIGEIEGKRNSSSDSKDDQAFKVHIRLKGSSLGYAGRVEISKDGEVWGTICDKAWSLRDARVICRQLNFPSTEAAVPMAGFGAGSGPIFLKDVKCGGSEQTLLKCKHDGWKAQSVNESCDHSMDAGVLCRPHKEDLQRILFIVMVSLLVFSYLVNIWFIYFVCCKQKRRRKRHLTAVQQKALTRKKLSQGLENLALDCEQCVDNTPVKQDSPVCQRNGIHPGHTERVSSEDGPTGVVAVQQEQQPHIYQRLESCLFDPSSREYLEIIGPLTQSAANQQPEMCTSEKCSRVTGYQSRSPQAPERKIEFSKDSENQYEKLLLRNMSSDNEHASSIQQEQIEGPSTTNDIPDYVEVIGDDNLAGIAMTTPTSPAACGNANVKRYETLKLGPGSSHSVQGDNASSCLTEDQKSVRAEQEEDDYVELLPENEAGGKESKMAASAPADNESEYEPMNN